MSVDAISTQPKERYMSPAKRRQMMYEIALEQLSRRQIASKYNRTVQYINRVAMDNADEIADLRAEIAEKQRELWIMDPYNRALERLSDIEDLSEEIEHVKAARAEFAAQMGRESEPINDLYLKLVDLKHKIMKQVEESSGQLPTRTQPPPPDHGKATYEIPGIDLGEVDRAFRQQERGVVEVPK